MDSPADPTSPRSGIVAVVGRTNSGKSTLMNRLLGEKVSIVSPVVQTTRNTIRGIRTEERGQLVLLDTPGLHKARNPLGTLMNKMARNALNGVDAVLLVIDGAEKPRLEDTGWMARLLGEELPCLFLLNKSDQHTFDPTPHHDAWAAVQQEKGTTREVTWLHGSAQEGAGMEPLASALFALLPRGPLLFDAESLTDYPRKLAIADTIREKYFGYLRDELPHAIGIWVDEITETPDQWTVSATVYVNRPSQKGIVIGPKGRMLRSVRREAEPELTEMFGVPVKLELWVKVEKNWVQNYWLLKQMGYVGA